MNGQDRRLPLHQEVLLLALNDKKGTVCSGTWYHLSLGGAILSELLLQGRVEVETVGKKSFLKLVNRKPIGDEVLDAAIEKVRAAKRRARLETWVLRLGSMKDLRHRVARQLCDQKILHADEKQLLLFFKQKIYPERDHGPEKEIIGRLRNAIFRSGRNADPRTVILLSLAHASQLLNTVFDKSRLKERKTHIEKLTQGATLGKATKGAVESARAAILAASLIPVMAATHGH